MRLSSTHVMKMTWKQNKQSQKAFRRQNVQYSHKICLRLRVFVLNQVRVFVSGAYRHTQHARTWLFSQKILSEEKIIISTFNLIDKYCAFIIVNFILYFNKCTNRLRADSLSLNCILVVREKTNTAYFYPLRKAEVSISTYHDYSSGKEEDRTGSFKRKETCSACARCIDAWSCGQSSVYATKYATRTVIM